MGHGDLSLTMKRGLLDLSFDFDGTTLRDLSFAFITQQLDLTVVE